ncbi:MAG: FmdE family protein [Thermodesulfobacteriota bacterium]
MGPRYAGHLLTLTNAGLVQVGEHDSSLALEALRQITACSLEKKSLILLNSAVDQPLYFFFYHRNTGESLFAQAEIDQLLSLPASEILARDLAQLFRHLILRNISLGRIISEAAEMESIFAQQPYGRKWASLINFAHFWAKNPPAEMVRVAQFHDHICPGVLSGYYISRFLRHKFALRAKERYFFLATPPYCKDDALQIIFNQTVGKKGMAAMWLAEEERALLLPEAREAAGIFFRYDPQTNRGQGAVLGFAWSKLLQDCKISDQKVSFLNSLKQILFMIDQRDEYARYVYFIKIFDLPPGESPPNYARVGVNPWQKLGLWSKKD